jgi:hypothetical protein
MSHSSASFMEPLLEFHLISASSQSVHLKHELPILYIFVIEHIHLKTSKHIILPYGLIILYSYFLVVNYKHLEHQGIVIPFFIPCQITFDTLY